MSGSAKIEKIRNSFGENVQLESIPEGAPHIICSNGTFAGKIRDDIEIYRGVPFACQPVGNLRWKAPQSAPDCGDIFSAYYNGKSPIQTEWGTELASYYRQGEDCLCLNIWMKTQPVFHEVRPVMVFFHGGSYGWGGTADPMYDGFNFVSKHPDVILITVGYRTGLLGFVDLSSVKGGEEFPDSANLGILDQIEALRWINRNCAAFGGDDENITIFGESAGGGSASLLPIIPAAKGLFRRSIVESGSVALTYSRKQCREFTRKLLELSGASSMDDLCALSEDELKRINEELNDYNNFPMRDGKLIPEDPYEPYRNGTASDVDMLIGTNKDEANYWVGEIGGIIGFRFGIPVKFENDLEKLSIRDRRRVHEFMKTRKSHSIWRMSEFYTEMLFRLPAICQAEGHSANNGRTYMYFWEKPSAIRYHGACHAVELAYVFGNTEETLYTGEMADVSISDMVMQMWVNFAKCGDPSVEGISWPLYDPENRSTMIITDNSYVENDPYGNYRILLSPMLKRMISPSYTGLNLNVPFVLRVIVLGGIIVGALVLLLLKLLEVF